MRFFKRLTIMFLCLLTTYMILLTVAYSIPNDWISDNILASLKMLSDEGDYPSLNSGMKRATRLDNYSDRVMITTSNGAVGKSPLENALYTNGYSRYWHGYQILLRPLLVFMGLGSIRMIYAAVMFLLIGFVFYFLIKRSDSFLASAFLISLASINAATFFFSMQYSNVWIVTLLAILAFLSKPRLIEQKQRKFLLFFVIGSVANFVDLLTTPLISWGIPILIILYISNKYSKASREPRLKHSLDIVLTGIFWIAGYALTWLSKWIIGSLVLRTNIIANAVEQASFRIGGSSDMPTDHIGTLLLNLKTMFPKIVIVLLLITVLIFIYFVIKSRPISKNPWPVLLQLALIAVTPYVWYMVFSNHSQIHAWFTYRSQAITVFALLSAIAFLISPRTSNEQTAEMLDVGAIKVG